MVVLHQSIFISNLITSRNFDSKKRNGGRRGKMVVAKRRPEESKKGELKFPIKKILSQVGIGVLSLGFIDAGYSGDWSRIGVISKEAEDVLKAAAFVVVPICMYVVYMISQEPAGE
ncbi:unnamed protein product [Rhodiola kirilowii]